MMKLISVVLLVSAILPMCQAIPNPPESAPSYSPEKAPGFSSPSVVKLCKPIPREVEIGCAEQVTAHYYLHDPRIQPECCFAIFRDEDCVAPSLSGLQLTPFGQDLKNYCSTLHY